MRYQLPPVLTLVENESVAIGQAVLVRHSMSDPQEVSERAFIPISRITDALKVLDRHCQQMDRRLWMNVSDDQHVLVAVHRFCRKLAGNDFAKDVGTHTI